MERKRVVRTEDQASSSWLFKNLSNGESVAVFIIVALIEMPRVLNCSEIKTSYFTSNAGRAQTTVVAQFECNAILKGCELIAEGERQARRPRIMFAICEPTL